MNSKKLGPLAVSVAGFLMFAAGIIGPDFFPWISTHSQIIFVGVGVLFIALGVMNFKKLN